MATRNRLTDAGKLTAFATRVLQKVGVPEGDARVTARMLVETDLRGIESHGVAHLGPFYVKRIKDGLVNPRPEIRMFSQAPGTATMDGDRGLGFVVGHRAMQEAIRRAEAVGAGFVSVRNSTHCGAASMYALMALPYSMVGVSLTTGGIGMVAPGSRGRGVGLNVISIAVPSGREAPFVLDMATSVVAGGKVEIAQRRGAAIPEGWAVDKDGQPVTDPDKYYAVQGALLPLGGTPQFGSYKGFGLAVAVDILCSVLSGSASISKLLREPNSTGRGNHFFGALRVDGFLPVDEFKKNMDDMVRVYHSLPQAPGVDRISLAGEIEHELAQQRRRDGIPLHEAVVASLKGLSEELSVEYDL